MKKTLLASLAWGLMSVQAADVWVSDEIEAPLREAPELNASIVTLLPAGQRVTVLDSNDDYVQIQTIDGKKGWLSNYYVLRETSVHDQLAPAKKALATAEAKVKSLTKELTQKNALISRLENDKAAVEKSAGEVAEQAKTNAGNAQKLSADNIMLQKKLTAQSEKMAELAKALDTAKQKASSARTRYLSLVKVSENAVDIDKQNRSLQEKVVQFEQEAQQLKNENQTLKAQLNTRQTMITALMIFGGILVGYVLSVMMPPRGRRSAGYSASLWHCPCLTHHD